MQEPRERDLDRQSSANVLLSVLDRMGEQKQKLEQVLAIRDEQLHKNRQLSAEFLQFDADTREVCHQYILWLIDQDSSLGSEDDYCLGSRNISHQQQSF